MLKCTVQWVLISFKGGTSFKFDFDKHQRRTWWNTVSFPVTISFRAVRTVQQAFVSHSLSGNYIYGKSQAWPASRPRVHHQHAESWLELWDVSQSRPERLEPSGLGIPCARLSSLPCPPVALLEPFLPVQSRFRPFSVHSDVLAFHPAFVQQPGRHLLSAAEAHEAVHQWRWRILKQRALCRRPELQILWGRPPSLGNDSVCCCRNVLHSSADSSSVSSTIPPSHSVLRHLHRWLQIWQNVVVLVWSHAADSPGRRVHSRGRRSASASSNVFGLFLLSVGAHTGLAIQRKESKHHWDSLLVRFGLHHFAKQPKSLVETLRGDRVSVLRPGRSSGGGLGSRANKKATARRVSPSWTWFEPCWR